jgi:hypothetical protein
VPIEDVTEMLKLTNAYARDQRDQKPAGGTERRDILPGHHHKALTETLLVLTRQQPRDETHEGEPQAVLNLDSKVGHEILIFVGIAADPSAGQGGA